MCDGTTCPCNLIEPAIGVDGVLWADPAGWAWPWGRCGATMPAPMLSVAGGVIQVGGPHGRCELRSHGPQVSHALRRGGKVLRFATAPDWAAGAGDIGVEVEWSGWFDHCAGRLEPGQSERWGRCDLRCHDPVWPCALEYGMHVLRFRTEMLA